MYLHLYINYMHTWFSLLSFLVFWTIYCILFYIVKVYFGHILSCLYSIFLAGTYHRSHDCDMKGKLLRFSQVCTYTTNLCVTTSQVKNCNIPWTHAYHFTLTENMTTYINIIINFMCMRWLHSESWIAAIFQSITSRTAWREMLAVNIENWSLNIVSFLISVYAPITQY